MHRSDGLIMAFLPRGIVSWTGLSLKSPGRGGRRVVSQKTRLDPPSTHRGQRSIERGVD